MPRAIDDKSRQRAERLLYMAAMEQSSFWARLRALEKALGVSVDATDDLLNTDIDTLLRKGEKL